MPEPERSVNITSSVSCWAGPPGPGRTRTRARAVTVCARTVHAIQSPWAAAPGHDQPRMMTISLTRTPGLPWPALPLASGPANGVSDSTRDAKAVGRQPTLISGTTVVDPPLERHAGRMPTTKVSPLSPGHHGPSARVSAHGRPIGQTKKYMIVLSIVLVCVLNVVAV